jgi:hypothetical protein
MTSLGREVLTGELSKRDLAAYGFLQFQQIVEETVWNSNADLVIFDITCLTKIHALALAASLAKPPRSVLSLLAYAVPDNYASLGDSPDHSPGWKDIIVAPLSESALLFNESSSRGIVIPGHEADRLIVALAEIEPVGGLIAVADTRRRPDLRYVTERRNQKIIRQLTRMRASKWVKRVVRASDMNGMKFLVDHEIERARKHSAPVILFPYGPKPLIFVSAFELALEYPEASWFVYPIPLAYDTAYSEGVDETVWLGQAGGK